MKCGVLGRKLSFLMRVMAGDTGSLSGSVLLAMCDDVESICLQLVRECREMEEHFEQYPFKIFFGFCKN